MKKRIDELDTFILKSLQVDATRPYKQIAGMLNTSTTTVSDRIKRLRENGYINRYVAVLDRKRLKQGILAYIHLSLNNNSEEAVLNLKEELSKIKDVCSCDRITGYYQIKLKIITVDSYALAEVETRVASLADVTTVHSYIVLKNIIMDMGFDFD